MKPIKGSKNSVADAIATYKRQTGRDHAIALKAPAEPAELSYLFRYFWLASRGRGVSQAGWMPIPVSEIEAVSRMYRITFKPWELEAIFRLDDIWRMVMSEETHTFDDDE